MPSLLFSRRQLLLGAAALGCGGRLLRAAEAPDQAPATFSAGVKVVNVFATVRDRHGAIVNDLVREDFTLAEDGVPQSIRYFSNESNLPLTIGLIVDTTASESSMLDEERATSQEFLNQMLRPRFDQAFLIQFNDEAELLQDLTSSREKLEAALTRLGQGGMRQPSGRGRGGGPPAGGGANSTVLSDSISLAADEVLRPVQGRKALIVLGDGDHIGSRSEQAIAAAHRADAIVYAIRIYDSSFGGGGGGGGIQRTLGNLGIGLPGMGGRGMGGGPGGGGPDGGGPGGGPGGPGGGPGGPGGGPGGSRSGAGLKNIALRTGGRYFETGKKQSLDEIYQQIEEDLRHQYSLGYTPLEGGRVGYRKLKIGVRRKGLAVQSREGYYASETAGAGAASGESRTEKDRR
jgi:VWFA-related protein